MAGNKPQEKLQTSQHFLVARRMRPPGLLSQIGSLLLRPDVFFRTLPSFNDTRQWVWVALLMMLLTGVTAVRQQSLSSGVSGFPTSGNFGGGGGGDVSIPGGTVAGGGGPVAIGGGDAGGFPTDSGVPPQSATPGDVSSTWVTALLAASGLVLSWIIQTFLLSEVSLFNGQLPRLGFNLQIAIWATLPLALMTGVQLLYYAAGGTVGQPGVSGLLAHWERYQQFPVLIQNMLMSFSAHLTLFWLWELALIYLGARHTLKGRRWAALLVVVLWAIVVVVAPVISGAINVAPPSA